MNRKQKRLVGKRQTKAEIQKVRMAKKDEQITSFMRQNAILKARFTAPIVFLCGSGRFKSAFDRAEYDLTLAGKIVLTIGCNTKDVARCEELAHHKPMLDELHLRKIDLCDEVLVLDVGGYIGESTRSEINYAVSKGRPVKYLSIEFPDYFKSESSEKPVINCQNFISVMPDDKYILIDCDGKGGFNECESCLRNVKPAEKI